MPIAEIPGGALHYESLGAGDPLVLLLPQSSGPVGVAPFLEVLSAERRVLSYDQLGTGQSAPLPSPEATSMLARATEVVGLLNALDIEKADLFCHSTGCGIGLALAATDGARVRRLVLAAPWSHGDAYLTGMQRLRVAAARVLAPADYARFNASLLYPPEYRRAHTEGFARQERGAAPADSAAIEARLDAILAFDARPMLAEIGHPCLIVTARDDQLMPGWFATELAAGLADGHLLELSGGGHMLPETRMLDLAEAIARHLDDETSAS